MPAVNLVRAAGSNSKVGLKKFLQMFSMYRGMPRSIYVLFFARIVNSIGSFVYPFLTMFLTDKLGLSTGDAATTLISVLLVLLVFVIIVTSFSFVYAQMTFSLPIQLMGMFEDRGPVIFGSIMTFNAG